MKTDFNGWINEQTLVFFIVTLYNMKSEPKRKEDKKMKILVLNCGSSSLKYQLINMETEEVLASRKIWKNRGTRSIYYT